MRRRDEPPIRIRSPRRRRWKRRRARTPRNTGSSAGAAARGAARAYRGTVLLGRAHRGQDERGQRAPLRDPRAGAAIDATIHRCPRVRAGAASARVGRCAPACGSQGRRHPRGPRRRREAGGATRELRADHASDAARVGGAAQAAAGVRPVVVVARSNLDVIWRLTGTEIERSDDAGKTWHRQPATTAAPLARRLGAIGRSLLGGRRERDSPAQPRRHGLGASGFPDERRHRPDHRLERVERQHTYCERRAVLDQRRRTDVVQALT